MSEVLLETEPPIHGGFVYDGENGGDSVSEENNVGAKEDDGEEPSSPSVDAKPAKAKKTRKTKPRAKPRSGGKAKKPTDKKRATKKKAKSGVKAAKPKAPTKKRVNLNKKVREIVGSMVQVWHGSADKTPGGLRKHDLVQSRYSKKIVSKKRSEGARERYRSPAMAKFRDSRAPPFQKRAAAAASGDE